MKTTLPAMMALALVSLVACTSSVKTVTASASTPTVVLAATPTPAIRATARKGAIHLEAADAVRRGGVTLATSRAGYTGAGYVTGFQNDSDQAVFTVPNAAPGLYDVHLRFCAPDGPKGFNLVVDGKTSSGMFPQTGQGWADDDAGKVELTGGANTLAIQKGWGYYDINSLDLVPAAPDPLPLPVPARLSDPQATPQARALMRFLVSRYGRKTLSGQHEVGDTTFVQQSTGETPAILGGDFIEYSPSRAAHGSDPKGESERMIQAAKAGQIVTMLWHWNAPKDLVDSAQHPWWSGFYTYGTTFDLQYALDHPQSEDYKLLLSDMDVIAAQLQKFQAAGVPVLWRPLHEASGGWFWWGAKGPAPFVRLWRLMYDRFTRVDHLHDLIWVDCSGGDASWYPGDAYVDVIGTDAYPSDPGDPLSSSWEGLQRRYGGRKLVALTEFGGVPDVDKMFRYGVRWSYFMSWSGDVGPHKMTRADLTRIYHNLHVLTEQELPGRSAR